ncbi:MAG: hypothetical protein ACJAYU_001477 [Bradymonadia bacterium]|jgi:uncharacterized protein YqeY
MSLLDTLKTDMKAAMKAREAAKLGVIRMLIAGLQKQQIDERRDLTEADEVDFIAREAKKRKESILAFDKGGRDDLSQIERAELVIIDTYLPAQMTEAEVLELIDQAIADTGASTPKDMGKVMGKIMKPLRGKFDGKATKDLVMSRLQG